ncbi:probable DUR3 - Urea permease [Melanopsichium pennsylvanicum]|uniref:Probable DUR3 - Urea permease n=2 Tax=Melanopsichium pennsylvanicum TaxID=63383 RepID=A0AAJ5C8H8_9BASI|nr:probable DUR3-Urea permease [Melanopsichium pennsylvanicum 4]SNX88022.1 probable DUR3 - Urea permease [Melanopsichium pennsylvanicum]
MAADSIPPPLSQGVGYGVVLGFGLAFAALMFYITQLLFKFNKEDPSHFETYSTAGRKIGTGLTATAVFSSWAWSTALLSSSLVTFSYGIAGAWWFAAGCLVQISAFALLAIQSKLKTPHAHTVLEVVKVRYGTFAHWLYMFFCLANNLIAIANMLLGASATVSALTGMHIIASTFLLPVGVCLYTISGGLKATFLTDWMHSVALLIIVLFLTLKTITNTAIESPAHLWELIKAANVGNPISGNHNGSVLTMTSKGAVEFGILHTLGNFGLVVMDSSYWQKAYSADIAAAVPGYVLGGVLYFGLPWCLGTVMGLAGWSLQNNPIWPAYGRSLSSKELSDGLPLAYAALAVAGKGGAVAVVILIFMAVTSTTSAQLIAVSSIVSSDVYHTYINPKASDKSVIRVSRAACIGFAIFASAFSTMLFYVGISLTWTLYFLGLITCPAMVSLPLTILWKKQTWLAAVVSPVVGMAAGIATWLGTASKYGNGVLNVTTTGELLPCMWGTIVAAFVPAILSPLITWIRPDPIDFAWEKFSDIKLIQDDSSSSTVNLPQLNESNDGSASPHSPRDKNFDTEKNTNAITTLHGQAVGSPSKDRPFSEAEERYMRRQSRIAGWVGLFLFISVWVLWPFIMYAAKYDFSKPFFTGWVVVAIIWAFVALLIFTFLPLWEGRRLISRILIALVTGKGPQKDDPSVDEGQTSSPSDSSSSNAHFQQN